MHLKCFYMIAGILSWTPRNKWYTRFFISDINTEILVHTHILHSQLSNKSLMVYYKYKKYIMFYYVF